MRVNPKLPVSVTYFSFLQYQLHPTTEILVEQTAFHTPVATLDYKFTGTYIIKIYRDSTTFISSIDILIIFVLPNISICLLDLDIGKKSIQRIIIIDIFQYILHIDTMPLAARGMCMGCLRIYICRIK